MPYDPWNTRREQLPVFAPATQIALALLLLLAGVACLYGAAVGLIDKTVPSSAVVMLTVALSLKTSLRGGSDGELDERDRALRYYAIATGGIIPVIVLAIYSLFASSFDRLWRPIEAVEWGVFGQIMLSSTLLCAIIAAARKTPAYVSDLDDED